ncbi:hypothetical protein [Pseudorhodobacter sp. MZDSW-24AT]|uniref:hypothetical protein n=1 Tax=Pseudorhodobacter sp. MZDSW-24AT TaxID=2052957 RepID=UPI000C1E4B7E|nr:hypothetical protein [Pseudorhodobacter sp. MZDSW-24AT]PJF08646.1 hypothetical protein CUR21_14650 [Pseudorhodobacter sp. MZDSW-24AT]
MIIGWLRFAFIGYVGLTIVYVIMRIYLRSVRRETLEKRFDAGGIEGDRATYIEKGMAAYDRGLKKNLLWLIYIIPTVAVVVTLYILNFQ